MMHASRRTFLATLAAGAVQTPAPPGCFARAEGQVPAIGVLAARFPTLGQRVGGRALAYLDNAATTLRPRDVIEAVSRYYEHDNANPSASLHTLARRSAAALDRARERTARFLRAADPREIVFTRGTTEGINLVASAWGAARIAAGDEIVVTLAEHASNLFPWQRLAAAAGARVVVVAVEDDGRLDLDRVERALGARTRLVAVTHVSNVLGLVYPVARVAQLARARGAAVLVDAAQSAPHVPLDVTALDCDFLAFSSHKLLGPMGVGVLWCRGSRLDEMPPYHVGSNMAHGLDFGTAAIEPAAFKFQAGTPNVSGPVGLAAALDVLGEIGWTAIAAHDHALSAHALTALGSVPGLRLIGTAGPADRVPVFSFTLDGVSPSEIVRAADAAGVALRAGDLAALPLLSRFGVQAAARASAYVYNTTAEIDRLVDVLKSLATRAG
jgi:cysteine desulfurase/selenocysteine lyase